MPRVIGVNGIRTDGRDNVVRLLEALHDRGHRTRRFAYPTVWTPLGARIEGCRLKQSRRLARTLRDGDHVVAHSFGATLTWYAMSRFRRQLGVVLFLGAALDADVSFPARGFRRLVNVHNPCDVALRLGALLWAHDFGAMGATGYAGGHPRIQNVEADVMLAGRWNHTAVYFGTAPLVERYADLFSDAIRQDAARQPRPEEAAHVSRED